MTSLRLVFSFLDLVTRWLRVPALCFLCFSLGIVGMFGVDARHFTLSDGGRYLLALLASVALFGYSRCLRPSVSPDPVASADV